MRVEGERVRVEGECEGRGCWWNRNLEGGADGPYPLRLAESPYLVKVEGGGEGEGEDAYPVASTLDLDAPRRRPSPAEGRATSPPRSPDALGGWRCVQWRCAQWRCAQWSLCVQDTGRRGQGW